MAIHLTPTELAREYGLERQEVLEKCVELGIPVFHGCIDKSLFVANVHPQTAARGRITSSRGAQSPLSSTPSASSAA